MATGQPETPQQRPGVDKGLQISGGALASGVGLAILLVFMFQNTGKVRVHFLFWHFTMAVWLLSLASALVGAFIWLGFGVLRRHRRRKERRAAR